MMVVTALIDYSSEKVLIINVANFWFQEVLGEFMQRDATSL